MLSTNCRSTLLASLASCVAVGALAGCSAGFNPSADAPVATQIRGLQGSVFGGQQPIQNAHVFVFQAGTGGVGGASTSLLTSSNGATKDATSGSATNGDYYVTTSSTGNFNLGGFTCTSGLPVYLYSVGGLVTTGVTNSAAGEMTMLGNCPSAGNFLGISYIYQNEVSTVAMAYAMAGFMTDPLHTAYNGASSNTTAALALVGLQNAATTAAQMYNISTPPSGNATASGNYSNGGALLTTPAGNGTVPQAEINTLADILAACINSASGSSASACTTVLGIKSAGSTGTTPTDTAIAAVNIAHNPTYNVSALFGVVTPLVPWVPVLSATPTNWTVTLAYNGGGIASNAYVYPHSIAIDGSGDVWAVNLSGNSLVELNPFGSIMSGPSGYTGGNLNAPSSVAIDTAGYAYVTNANATTVSRFTSTGGVAPGSPLGAALTLSGPSDVAIDGSGNLQISNAGYDIFNENYIVKSTNIGSPLATTTVANRGNAILGDPVALAMNAGAAGDVWVANYQAGANVAHFTDLDVTVGYPSAVYTSGIAIDASANVWAVNANRNRLYKIVTGSGTASISLGYYPNGLAIDGAGAVWVSDYYYDTLYKVTTLSATGYTELDPANPGQPLAIAIDGSGNIWWPSGTDAFIRQMVGAATPVVTPIAQGVTVTKLGTRP